MCLLSIPNSTQTDSEPCLRVLDKTAPDQCSCVGTHGLFQLGSFIIGLVSNGAQF